MDYNVIFSQANMGTFKKFSESLKKLNEMLIPANQKELNKQMAEYPDLNKFFHTPIKDLDPLYKNLVPTDTYESYNPTTGKTVEEVETIRPMISRLFMFQGEYLNYFSVQNGKATGFVSLRVDRNDELIILDIKFFAFFLDKTLGLLRDMERLIEDCVKKYKYIRWAAFKRNIPGNRLYHKIAEKYHGFIQEQKHLESPQDDELIYYIPGVEELPNWIKVNVLEDFS